jgi:hypothetical protein
MSITKAQTNKLLTNINGKQAFLIITQGVIERMLEQPPTFADAEIKRMMEAIWDNPHNAHEYREWHQAWLVMTTAMYEGRLAIMEAMNSMQMQLMITSHVAYDNKIRKHEKMLEWAEEHKVIMDKQHKRVIYWLQWAQRWQIMLQAFDNVLSTRMNDTLKKDNERLEIFIAMYHDRMSWVQYDIDFTNMQSMKAKTKSKKVINKMMAELDAQADKWQLPPLEIAADNPMLQHCIAYLNQCPDKPFYKVLDVIEGA